MRTAGESHGPAIVVILEGVPAGLPISAQEIDKDLLQRQRGYGRGARMAIEQDEVAILAGIRRGVTIGSPIALSIRNRDHENWRPTMAVDAEGDDTVSPETKPRPGHGDLAGMLKFGTGDARDVLERASARETAARVAAGAVARRLLRESGITVRSRVVAIGGVADQEIGLPTEDRFAMAAENPVRCADEAIGELMVEEIDKAMQSDDTVGGIFEVVAFGVMPGLGSYAQSDQRLDGRLTAALASIPGIKGVEVGGGFALSSMRGSEAHDEIFYSPERGLFRTTNRAGGLEAGITNGSPLVLRAAMKPIPTLARPLATVDLQTLEPSTAFRERADVCAVPAAAVVGEAMVATVLADATLEKFGGDSLVEYKRNLEGYLGQISRFWRPT